MTKLLTIIFFLFSGIMFSQNQKKNYPQNYLPVSIDDALDFMSSTWTNEQKEEFKNTNERDAVLNLHFTYGMAIRNSWLRHGDPKFAQNFYDKGVYGADDISYVLLTAFHRKLNSRPIKLNELTKPIKKQSKKDYKNHLATLKSGFKKFRVNDTVNFRYYKTIIGNEPGDSLKYGNCKCEAIILKKRKKDFSLNLKLIKACDEEGIYILVPAKVDYETINIKPTEIFWDKYWSWEYK